MKKFMVVVSVLFLAVGLSGFMLAPVPTGTAKITVKAKGLAVGDARVSLNSSGDSSYSGSGVTDAGGSFQTSGVPVGTVQVKVYDSHGKLLVTGNGGITGQGAVLSLNLSVTQ